MKFYFALLAVANALYFETEGNACTSVREFSQSDLAHPEFQDCQIFQATVGCGIYELNRDGS